MPRAHTAVPQNQDPEAWRQFIDAEIPPIEGSTSERRLQILREKALNLITHRFRSGRVNPINPVAYEGRLDDRTQFVMDHAEMPAR